MAKSPSYAGRLFFKARYLFFETGVALHKGLI